MLRMGDGPPQNLPDSLDAYAGYVDDGGIGITWPEVEQIPAPYHLSISVHGTSADCADLEKGALSDWRGYDYGYCDLANAQSYIDTFGRPKKLWIAHHNSVAHVCTPNCGFGFRDFADGTQWIDHNGLWDESLLNDNFFDLEKNMTVTAYFANNAHHVYVYDNAVLKHWWNDLGNPGWHVEVLPGN